MTEAEIQALQRANLNPDDYVAFDVILGLDTGIAGAVVTVQGPRGPVDMVITRWQLAIPLANLKTSRVLEAGQQVPNPLNGMLPQMQARCFIPKKRVRENVLKQLGIGVNDDDAEPSSTSSTSRVEDLVNRLK